jgi:hypothetical protein
LVGAVKVFPGGTPEAGLEGHPTARYLPLLAGRPGT